MFAFGGDEGDTVAHGPDFQLRKSHLSTLPFLRDSGVANSEIAIVRLL